LCKQKIKTTDIWHKYWTCPCIVQEDHSYITDSNHSIKELKVEEIAFYNRALLCEHNLPTPEGFQPLVEYPFFTSKVKSKVKTEVKAVPKPLPKPKGIKGRVRDLSEFEGFVPNEGPILLHLFPKWLDGLQPEQQEESSTARPSTDPAPLPEPVPPVPHPESVPTPWPSGHYFGDGSGGKYSKYPTPRRAGVGLHSVNEDKVPTYIFWASVTR